MCVLFIVCVNPKLCIEHCENITCSYNMTVGEISEPRDGWAKDLFDGCSCGIDYTALGISYADHLELDHVIDPEDEK